MIAYRARYVFPADGPPISGGVVAVDHDRIVAVGRDVDARMRDSVSGSRDLGNVAILPGLINPHTHLEFSDLTRPLGTPGMAFPDWIRLVVQLRRQRPSTISSVESGIQESIRCGVTALGEIAKYPPRPRSDGPEVTHFCELLGLKRGMVEDVARAASDVLADDSQWSEAIRPALSPHAPYTVHPDLLLRMIELSAMRGLPVAHHLAESREELQLLREASGPFVELLKDLNAWDADAIPRGSTPMDYLRMLTGARRALVIHGNYLDEDEIEFLAGHAESMSLVYCPRTHAYFRHERYPLAQLLAAGVQVAIGTDSRASNPDLSVLAEIQQAAKMHTDVAPASLLRMITADAARALGRESELGAITLGKFADLTMVTLPDHEAEDPHELLLDPGCRAVATIIRGRVACGDVAT